MATKLSPLFEVLWGFHSLSLCGDTHPDCMNYIFVCLIRILLSNLFFLASEIGYTLELSYFLVIIYCNHAENANSSHTIASSLGWELFIAYAFIVIMGNADNASWGSSLIAPVCELHINSDCVYNQACRTHCCALHAWFSACLVVNTIVVYSNGFLFTRRWVRPQT